MNDKEKLACVLIVIAFALTPVAAILNGWVLSILWRWFIVSTFGLPQLTIPAAIGLSIVVGMFRYNQDIKGKDATGTIAKLFSEAFVGPLIALLFGYIVYQFI